MATIRKATIEDVRMIHGLLMHTEDHDALVLPRSLSQLYSRVRDFVVMEEGGDIVGCCALSIIWEDLAEIRSLVVKLSHRGQGFGRKLVDACMSEAATLGLPKVYTLTEQTGFFAHLGFKEHSMDKLNQKIFIDCMNCPRFPDHCNEVAMIMEL